MGSVSTVLNPIFSKKVQGQKHPGRWGIVLILMLTIHQWFMCWFSDICFHWALAREQLYWPLSLLAWLCDKHNHVLWFNIFRPRQNGRNFPDDIFKCIVLNENVWISIKISLKFVPSVRLTIFQHWLRKWLGAVQATSHYMNQWWLVYWRIYMSRGLIELTRSCIGSSVFHVFMVYRLGLSSIRSMDPMSLGEFGWTIHDVE